MKSNYQEAQRSRSVKLFYGAQGGQYFMTKDREFVLKEGLKNLFEPIRTDAITYFRNNKVSWWGGIKPTGHILSSQIACINHLFQIRNDKSAVLGILNTISKDFIEVLEIETDKFNSGYIQFESVSDFDHLNEGTPTRGNLCTSVDALIFALHRDGTKWLIPIEWKFTEYYNNQNKSIEGYRKDPENCKGEVRKKRYTNLINQSKQLKGEDHSTYYFEPFYQLMRQTLWAEQMIVHNDVETIKADNFLHVHVIPRGNKDLLSKRYKCSGLDMESTWKSKLKDQSMYVIIDPKDLMAGINKAKYGELTNYLSLRYWNV